MTLDAAREAAETELAKANNEFGSETHAWPDLWKRIAALKELSNERWRRAEAAERAYADESDQHDKTVVELEAMEARVTILERERDALREALENADRWLTCHAYTRAHGVIRAALKETPK